MPVTSISDQKQLLPTQKYQKTQQDQSFPQILKKQKNSVSFSANNSVQQPEKNIVEIGTINDATPTVSHILKENVLFKDKSWDIVFSELNKNKQYTNMLPGTKVSINTQTQELNWTQSPGARQEIIVARKNNTAVEKVIQPEKPAALLKNSSIDVGIISKNNPTVSHLLKNKKNILGNYWKILSDPINQDKPFTTLRPGTKVSLNTETKELSFESTKLNMYATVHSPVLRTPPIIKHTNELQQGVNKGFSEKLAGSLKPLIGRPYKEIDCYGLVVRGLIKQGVNYQGKGGLRQSLENAAKTKGLPGNAFLTGEGLIKNSGTTLYSKTYLKISNFRKQADEIFTEIKNTLEPGLVLSFSTPSRGHTGVVAKRDNMWTYINSGLMDNPINESPGRSRKVGEEILEEEIKNWCQRAKHRDESLSITMGKLDEEKLKKFSKNETVLNLPKI